MVSVRQAWPFDARKRIGALLVGILTLAVVVVGFSPPTYAKAPKLKKPGAPTSVVAMPIGEGVQVTWGPPTSDGGGPVTGYLVSVGSGTRTISCATVATSCTVHGLINGRQYRAKVRASSDEGQGKSSLSGKFVPGRSADCSDFQPGASLLYCDLAGVNFSGLDLAGVDFWGSRLVDADFSGADLSGALFGGDTGAQVDLSDVDFDGATMIGTNLADMYLYVVSFDGANLTNATFDGASLIFDSFVNTNLTGAEGLDHAEIIYPTWSNTTCPDGSNSNDQGGTCTA
jgi:Fibronectin type III domain/Pentapeptide repeats (8 copies)